LYSFPGLVYIIYIYTHARTHTHTHTHENTHTHTHTYIYIYIYIKLGNNSHGYLVQGLTVLKMACSPTLTQSHVSSSYGMVPWAMKLPRKRLWLRSLNRSGSLDLRSFMVDSLNNMKPDKYVYAPYKP
jgi:hypothetical protein